MVGHGAHDVGEGLVDGELPGHLAVVEAHAGARHPVQVAPLQAVLEDLPPAAQRRAPLAVAGQHSVRVGGEPAAREAAVHILRHEAEVLVHGGVVGVGVGEPVVLVGGQGELAAGGAAEGEPGVGHRRFAEAVGGELEQARGDGVGQHGEHARERGAVEVGVHEVEEQLRHVRRHADELLLVGGPLDRSAQGEGAAAVQRHEVAGRDDADHVLVRVEHGEVVHAGRHHGDAGLGGERLAADGVHRGAHDGRDRRVSGDVAHHHLVAHVHVGDDAESLEGADQDAGAAALGHDPRRLTDAGVRLAEQGRAAHDGRHRQGAHLRAGHSWTARPG